MSDALETLRGYVHFLHEREGVRQLKLTRAAREGLAKLVRSGGSASGLTPTASSRTAFPDVHGREGTRVPTSTPVARSATATQPTTAPRVTVATETIPTPGSSKIEQLAHLNERAQACQKCPHRAARRHTVVFGVGDPDAKLMFVGEGPGEEEDLKGEPFVGRAAVTDEDDPGDGPDARAGLHRQHREVPARHAARRAGNRKPTRDEMDTCVPYLRAQIDVIKPAALVALARTAVEGLLGVTGTRARCAAGSSSIAACRSCRRTIPPTCCATRATPRSARCGRTC